MKFILEVQEREDRPDEPPSIKAGFMAVDPRRPEPPLSLGQILSRYDAFERLQAGSLVVVSIEPFRGRRERRCDESAGEAWIQFLGSTPHAILKMLSPSINGISDSGVTHVWTFCGQHYASRPGEDWFAEW